MYVFQLTHLYVAFSSLWVCYEGFLPPVVVDVGLRGFWCCHHSGCRCWPQSLQKCWLPLLLLLLSVVIVTALVSAVANCWLYICPFDCLMVRWVVCFGFAHCAVVAYWRPSLTMVICLLCFCVAVKLYWMHLSMTNVNCVCNYVNATIVLISCGGFVNTLHSKSPQCTWNTFPCHVSNNVKEKHDQWGS